MNFSTAIVAPLPSYNWSVSNGTITAGQGSNNVDVTWGTGTGTVNVSASNTCGVSGLKSQSFTGISCREETGASNNLSVYPNPAHDKVTVSIDIKDHTAFNIMLRDISGRIILSENKEGEAGLNVYEMDLRNFAKGIYTLEIQSASENRMTKVVVE